MKSHHITVFCCFQISELGEFGSATQGKFCRKASLTMGSNFSKTYVSNAPVVTVLWWSPCLEAGWKNKTSA